jgi:hypothetical protein
VAAVTQLEAMALTYAIEACVAALLALRISRAPLLCALAAVAGSTVTHPILWAIFYDAQAVMGSVTTPLLEAAVMAAEVFAYRLIATPRWDEASLLSVLANLASWGTGEAIYALS